MLLYCACIRCGYCSCSICTHRTEQVHSRHRQCKPVVLTWIDRTNSLMNHMREYWYMGSMAAMSRTAKKSTALEDPVLEYCLRAASISRRVSSATAGFSSTSIATSFASERMATAVASSRMFPWESLSTWRHIGTRGYHELLATWPGYMAVRNVVSFVDESCLHTYLKNTCLNRGKLGFVRG